MFIAGYVNNLTMFDTNINLYINNVMQNFQERFQILDFSELSHYLMMKVNVDFNKKIITLQQLPYLEKILREYWINNCKPAKISIHPAIAKIMTTYEDLAEKNRISMH